MKIITYNLDESSERFSLVDAIINQEIPDGPGEVKQAVSAYAQGNPGAARKIACASKGFSSKDEVERFVGWPISKMRGLVLRFGID